MRANLNEIARDITLAEGLQESVSIAQVKEILGLLGKRWREVDSEQMLTEVRALVQRGGKRKK